MTERTILITGCSTGIGYAAAHILKKRGWRVFASCRKPEDCARLIDEGLEAPLLDLTSSDSIETALAEVLEATNGRLDALFNNGAYALPGPLEDIPTGGMREIFEANFFGWHHLTRAVIPVMRAQGHGRIINNSSLLGMVAALWRGPYVATKFALEGWSDTLRLEMKGTGIEVSLVSPGPIDTPFRDNTVPHFEKWVDWENSARVEQYRTELLDKLYKGSSGSTFELQPDAVVTKVIRALEARRPHARYYVTTPSYLAAGLRRILPAKVLDRILRLI